MREILFKAKSLETGKWIEGYYVYYSESILKDNLHMIVWGKNFQEWDEVDPETVCQYTGLTDKSGKKVFESDIIVAYDENYKWFVSFQLGCWIVETEKSWDFLATNARDIEVIGNIHDEED